MFPACAHGSNHICTCSGSAPVLWPCWSPVLQASPSAASSVTGVKVPMQNRDAGSLKLLSVFADKRRGWGLWPEFSNFQNQINQKGPRWKRSQCVQRRSKWEVRASKPSEVTRVKTAEHAGARVCPRGRPCVDHWAPQHGSTTLSLTRTTSGDREGKLLSAQENTRGGESEITTYEKAF